METQEQNNPLKPVPNATAMVDTTGQLVMIGAMAGPGVPFLADRPLCWWHKAPGQDKWTLIEARDALRPIDGHSCFIRVDFPKLLLAASVRQVLINCSDSRDVQPSGDGVICPRPPGEPFPPELPIVIGGEGSPPGETPKRVEVSLGRTRVPNTKDEILWVVIRNSANSLGFDVYQSFMDDLFCHKNFGRVAGHEKRELAEALDLPIVERFPYSSVDAFRVLKFATELFVMSHCGVVPQGELATIPADEEARFGHLLPGKFEHLWRSYMVKLGHNPGNGARILPYLDLIRRKLGDIGTTRTSYASIIDQQSGLLHEKLIHPVLLELIWSYWMEEGMLVQGFNSIIRRFQNVRANGERDPLAQLEIDPLRPLNNLIWGWVQDEILQLSVLRRAHEYDHHYGFTLHGKATADLRTADRRSKFLEAFHNLLWRCIQFYRQDDDTTVIADGFTVLNALKETHYLLAQGAHNQFGDLPSTARQEMLMQQWLLSRPEMREFLGGRVMVPYPEPWMDRVDALKTLKGWTSTSVVHFRDLATFGEQILLSVRWGAWSTINDPNSAANWARYWRAEIQGYVHAYRAATSVDLTAEITDQRQVEQRFLPPSVHLRRMLAQGAR